MGIPMHPLIVQCIPKVNEGHNRKRERERERERNLKEGERKRKHSTQAYLLA